ncbi:amino acid ABC transporter permease [Parapusillimonas sp. SGNA-6]|jgi:polar amino acid transport system permease protein|nr:amino acid ABC transporter permease [Parapusillimonas sp. SGNA-6]
MTYQFDFSSVLAYWPLFLEGAWTTIQMSFWATLAGFTIGVLCAVARTGGPRRLRRVVTAYVEVIRNTPLLIQSYFLIFGMASVGIRMPIMAGAVLALVINIGAYTCEIVRAGIESVHKGQREAGACLGLTPGQVYWHVILRPAIERVYPALASQYVLLMLATSILSAVGANELFGASNQVQANTFRNFEVFIVLWVAYLALTALVRGLFWAVSQCVFVRRRKLGTPL